jgi:G3E family GTPase
MSVRERYSPTRIRCAAGLGEAAVGRWGVSATAVPLTVIGGYLGAGKTTLINALLREPGGRRLGVVVNDFGSLAIDAALLADAADGLVSLPNGCVCCSLGTDLQAALAALINAPSPPDQIVVEVSGVADPAATAAWGTVPPYMPGGVVVLADAADVRDKARDRYVGGEVVRQVEGADLLIVAKCDLVSSAELERTEQWLEQLAPDAPRIRSVQGDVPADVVLGMRPYRLRHPDHESQAHDERYVRWSWSSHDPVAPDRVGRFVQRLPGSVVRAKGIVRVGLEVAVRVEAVGSRRDVSEWKGATPDRSELVAIGLRGSMEPDELSTLAADELR